MRWVDPAGDEAVGAIVGAIFGGIQGALTARTTHSNWIVGGIVGAAFGGALGALDPTLGIGTMMTIGGGAAFASSIIATLVGDGPGNWGSFRDINPWGLAGATLGGVMAGAFGGVYPAAGAGAPLLTSLGDATLSNTVGGLVGYLSEVSATALGSGGRIPEWKPWQDTGTGADWLRAAGCKP